MADLSSTTNFFAVAVMVAGQTVLKSTLLVRYRMQRSETQWQRYDPHISR